MPLRLAIGSFLSYINGSVLAWFGAAVAVRQGVMWRGKAGLGNQPFIVHL